MAAPPKAPPKGPAGKGGQGPLTKKVGPLPMWVWLALVGVVVVIMAMGKSSKKTKDPDAAAGEQDGAQYGNDASPLLIGGNQSPPVVFESFQSFLGLPPFGGRPFPPCGPMGPPGVCTPGQGQWITAASWKKHGAPWNATCRGMAQACYGDPSAWERIWDAPENRALRHRRRNSDDLRAGDLVWIPPLNAAGQACAPGGPGPYSPGPYGGACPPPMAPGGGVGMPPPPPPPPGVPPMPGPPGPPPPAGAPAMPGPAGPGRSGGRYSRSRR